MAVGILQWAFGQPTAWLRAVREQCNQHWLDSRLRSSWSIWNRCRSSAAWFVSHHANWEKAEQPSADSRFW